MFSYPAAEHVVTGNLKVISDPRIRKIFSNARKYRVSNHIDFNKSRKVIAFALNDFGNRWCKRELVGLDATKNKKK